MVVDGNKKEEVTHFSPIYMLDFHGGFSSLQGRGPKTFKSLVKDSSNTVTKLKYMKSHYDG